MWVGVDMQVEVVGGWNAEIGRVWKFLTPRGRYRAYLLDIAWPLEMHGGRCIRSMWVDADMWVEVVGGRDAEIDGGRGF